MANRRTLDADWYRRNIERSADLDFQAGPIPVLALRNDPLPITVAFGTLVRLERRNKRLSVAQLAERLAVDEEEVRLIEHDTSYRAKPRTIICIANEFGLPRKEIMKLAGAAKSRDEPFEDAPLKVAGHSDDMGVLPPVGQRMLRSFVEFLKDQART